jgi:transposase
MTREEREEYVVQLYKENNSIRQIAKLVHMSFRDIGVIINRAKLQAERERGYTDNTTPKSPESGLQNVSRRQIPFRSSSSIG